MDLFDVTLRHDHGEITIHTSASSEDWARRSVLAAERAPESAVVRVVKVDEVTRAMQHGVFIREITAQDIARRWTPGGGTNCDLARLASGMCYSPSLALSNVDRLIENAGTSDVLPELHALRDWILEQVPSVVIDTQEIPADEWAEAAANGDVGPSVFRPTTEVFMLHNWEDEGEWVSIDDPRVPGLPERNQLEHSGDDSEVWLPESRVETAARMLSGFATGFWAQNSDEFPTTGRTWWSHEDHPYTDDKTVKSARLTGFDPEETEEVYKLWRASFPTATRTT